MSGYGSDDDGIGGEGRKNKDRRLMMRMFVRFIIMWYARSPGPVAVVSAFGGTVAVGACHFGFEANEAVGALVSRLGLL